MKVGSIQPIVLNQPGVGGPENGGRWLQAGMQERDRAWGLRLHRLQGSGRDLWDKRAIVLGGEGWMGQRRQGPAPGSELIAPL